VRHKGGPTILRSAVTKLSVLASVETDKAEVAYFGRAVWTYEVVEGFDVVVQNSGGEGGFEAGNNVKNRIEALSYRKVGRVL
jgi:hypothetical protein